MKKNNIPKILEFEDTTLPYGWEMRYVTERTGEDGKKSVTKQYRQRIEFGNHYVVISHHSGDGNASLTMIFSGSKGEQVDADWRMDEIQITCLKADGSIAKSPKRTQPVRINKHSGKNNREILEEALVVMPNPSCKIPAAKSPEANKS